MKKKYVVELAGDERKMLGDLICAGMDLFAIGLPYCGDSRQKFHQTGAAAAAVVGEIGQGKKGLFIRGHDNRHGPATAAGHGLGGDHIHLVDIRAFLAIDFYRYKMLI